MLLGGQAKLVVGGQGGCRLLVDVDDHFVLGDVLGQLQQFFVF